jgi:Asp-tRNA(Asn)/Glu-tRNA(Gln) amidotransferase A subunit family amidase
VFSDHVPSTSAEAVLRLEHESWVNVGKANLHEFAYGVTSQNLHYGTVPNPAHPGLTAGGSSGGSAAAIVLGLADGALGTDTGGSIRIPAACCGIAGFKPTFGLVPVDGLFPLAPSFDHAGPMARDVAGCIRLMRALVPGFGVGDVALDELSLATAWGGVPVRGAAIEFPTAAAVSPAFMREVGDVHRSIYAEHHELYGENIRGKVERCIALSDEEYATAVRARAEHAERASAAMEGYDLLVVPTLSCAVPPADVNEVEIRAAMTLFTFPFNALGWPALTLPAGPGTASLQVVGRPGDDALVLAAGLELEAALRA